MFRKFLALISICALIANGTGTVLACSNDYYTAFEKLINDKNTFVYFFGATDCPNCLATEQKVWNILNAKSSFNPNQSTLDYYLSAETSMYENYNAINAGFLKGTAAYNRYTNMKLLHYNVDKVADIFKDSFVKKVVTFLITQFEKKFTIPGQPPIKYLTRNDIKLSGTPFFLFFDQGQFQGFYQGAITQLNSRTASGTKKVGFFPLMYSHIVNHNWGTTL